MKSINEIQKYKEQRIISIIRIFAMILILICHIVQKYPNKAINASAQIFNVGVFIFLFISGFLYGGKDINNIKQWYLKRAIRILIPMYVFIIVLSLLDIIFFNTKIPLKYFFVYLLNMQGVLGLVDGAQHLWFLTALMFCYLITPLLNKYKEKFRNKNTLIRFLFITLFVNIIVTIFLSMKLGLYLGYMYTYLFAYCFGFIWRRNISTQKLFLLSIITFIALGVRVVSRNYFDSNVIYDGIIVIYEQIIFAVWIFILSYKLIDKFIHETTKFKDIILNLDSMSFYIYITHYIFVMGPISLMSITDYFILNTVIALAATYVSAQVLSKLCNCFYKNKLLRRSIHEDKYYSSSI